MLEQRWIRRTNSPLVVVFLHGILSDARSAWLAEHGVSWPTLVPAEVMGVQVDVLSLQYPADIANATYTITDVVGFVDASLTVEGVLDRRAVVFVAHSMGGLIIRRWLVDRQLRLAENGMRIGVLLVASPSKGSVYADRTRLLARFFGNIQHHVLLTRPNNDWLRSLDQAFRGLLQDGHLPIWGRELVEDRPQGLLARVPLLNRWQKPVVSDTSANCYFSDPVRIPGSTHSSIAKPESEDALQNLILQSLLEHVLAGGLGTGPSVQPFSDVPIPLPGPVFAIPCSLGADAARELNRFLDSGAVPHVCVLIGGAETGKSTLLHRVQDARREGVSGWDLRTPAVLASFLQGSLPVLSQSAILLDHLEEAMRYPALRTPERVAAHVAALAQAGRKVVVAIDRTWVEFAQAQFGASFQAELDRHIGGGILSIELMPMPGEEVARVLPIAAANGVFDPPEFRTPGMVSLVLAVQEYDDIDSKNTSQADLSYLLLSRSFADAAEQAFLTELAASVGGRAGRLIPYEIVKERVQPRVPSSTNELQIASLVKEPLVVKHTSVGFGSERLALDALAIGLLDAAQSGAHLPRVDLPPDDTILERMRAHSTHFDVALDGLSASLDSLRGRPFSEIGYTGILLARMAMEVFEAHQLDLSDIWLQGPPDADAVRVPETVRTAAADAVSNVLVEGEQALRELLGGLQEGLGSCWNGSDVVWRTTREWARDLPLKQALDSVVAKQLSELSLWRYEDLLDGVITAVTSDHFGRGTYEPLATRLGPISEVMADVWDGANDGLWDSLWGDWQVLDRFGLSAETRLDGVCFAGSHVQRASFAGSDVTGVDFSQAELHLADFRSAKGIQSAQLVGANWWEAILVPSDRYALASRPETDERWIRWCEDPPWHNPFFTSAWPTPFGDERVG